MCTGLKPSVKELAKLLLVAGRRLEMSRRTPPVGHQGVVSHMITKFSQGLTAIALPVFRALRDLEDGSHLDRYPQLRDPARYGLHGCRPTDAKGRPAAIRYIEFAAGTAGHDCHCVEIPR